MLASATPSFSQVDEKPIELRYILFSSVYIISFYLRFDWFFSSSGTIIHLDINVVLVPDEGASLSCSHTIIIKIKQLNEASTNCW